MKASEQFVKGKNGIGYVSSDFNKHFGDVVFEKRSAPSFKKLERSMKDAQIESELKPGICDLGDILAFIENPPEGTKDGYYNLFYTENFVVGVGWDDGEWRVCAWGRGGSAWRGGFRVFSPATVRSGPCRHCCSCTLELRNSALETWKKNVEIAAEKLIEAIKTPVE